MKNKVFSLLLAVVIFCGGYYIGQSNTDYQSTTSQTTTGQAAASTQRAYSSDIMGKSATTHSSTTKPKPSTSLQTANPFSASYDPTVYVTDTGSKYHNAGCSYLKSKHEIRLSVAIDMGYTPCSRCSPPT